MKKLLFGLLLSLSFFVLFNVSSYADGFYYPEDTYYHAYTITRPDGVVNTCYFSSSEFAHDDCIFYHNSNMYYLYIWDGSRYVSYTTVGAYMVYTVPNQPTTYNYRYRVNTLYDSNDYSTVFFIPVLDYIPTSHYEPISIDDGLGYDISLSHTEFRYGITSAYWEFISVKGAWNYPTVRELSFDIYVNGDKRDTINKLNNFSTNFGIAFDFFTTTYNVVEGDTIRILCTPLGANVKGLARGVEWVVGSKENIPISKIPNVTPNVDINNVPYTPTIQKERQFIYNPITNEYVTNNYYTQNYESPDLSNIESQLDYIIQYLENNPTSNGGNEPQTIINNNITNKNYNFDFGDINFGDLDVDFEIGSAKEDVTNSFSEFISFLSILTLSTNLNKIVVALAVGIGTVLTVLAIVIVVKILDFFIPG